MKTQEAHYPVLLYLTRSHSATLHYLRYFPKYSHPAIEIHYCYCHKIDPVPNSLNYSQYRLDF